MLLVFSDAMQQPGCGGCVNGGGGAAQECDAVQLTVPVQVVPAALAPAAVPAAAGYGGDVQSGPQLSMRRPGPGLQQGVVGKARPEAPHLLLVLFDDLGYNDLGSFRRFENGPGPAGGPDPPSPRTPVMDSLMAAGIRLANLYVAPLCSPTRAALLVILSPPNQCLLWIAFFV